MKIIKSFGGRKTVLNVIESSEITVIYRRAKSDFISFV